MDILVSKIEEAKRLGVEEVVVSVKMSNQTFEKDLHSLAQLLEI